MKKSNIKTDTYQDKRVKQSIVSVSSFFSFLALSAFIVTCCIIMFISLANIRINWSMPGVKLAALRTLGNVLFFGLVFSILDNIRKRITVCKPINKILQATSKITKGDFSVRIEPLHSKNKKNEFDVLIDDLNKMADEIGSLETLRSDFIANVSHEMKTPLSVMNNYAVLLKSKEIDDKARIEYADKIYEASGRLSGLITNILKLNKLENQQIFPETIEYDLSEQLYTSLLIYEPIWEKRNLKIEIDIQENIMINADSELMQLVWANILSNAFKFTPDGGSIILKAEKHGSRIIVSVGDTGCGMSDDIQKHIFEKFYQGEKSHSTKGNGLGLALVKRIVDILNGKIEVQSEIGKGTTFVVELRG